MAMMMLDALTLQGLILFITTQGKPNLTQNKHKPTRKKHPPPSFRKYEGGWLVGLLFQEQNIARIFFMITEVL